MKSLCRFIAGSCIGWVVGGAIKVRDWETIMFLSLAVICIMLREIFSGDPV